MTELKIRDGDYVFNSAGTAQRVKGREALLQRVLFKLTARRGAFPFLEEMGSTLYRLGSFPPSQRQGAAQTAAAQALADEEDLELEQAELDGERLTVHLRYQGEPLELKLTVR